MATVRGAKAQPLAPYLCNRFTIIDGERAFAFPGAFVIFGHGNVTCLSNALEPVKDRLPIRCGQNEPSMALAAIGFAKAKRRRQIMLPVLLDEWKNGLLS
jgi:3D-(3,5/4)-trihydroxycyclohexane-1,2-dione acylhydrolase (decyclizing)